MLRGKKTTMTTYEISTDGVSDTIEAATLADARRLAERWLATGTDAEASTVWVDGHLSWTDEDGDEMSERVRATVEPAAPRCTGAGHDWQRPHALVGGLAENPGVHGHGGGVVIVEVCMECGCKRTRDTWAHHPSTGEQGLESLTYERHAYSDEELASAREETDA